MKEITKRRRPSPMFVYHFFRLVFRCIVFLGGAYLYFWHRDVLIRFTEPGFFSSFELRTVIWILFMFIMVAHLLPKTKISMSGRKLQKDSYISPLDSFEIADLYQYVQTMNIKAWTVMLLWLCFNSIFAALYLLHIIGAAEMLMLSAVYYVSDLICMLIFCPFQTWIMKNRCCVNCRIFDWGHFMIFTPMLFVRSFFCWSLFFTSCVVLIRWELVYATHPERFWNGSNAALRCENCHDKLCYIKDPLADIYRNIHARLNGMPEKKE